MSRLVWKIRTGPVPDEEPSEFDVRRVIDSDELEMEIAVHNRKVRERRSGVRDCVEV